MTGAGTPVGVALTGRHLAQLLDDPWLTATLDDAGLAFAVAGIDRIDGAAPPGPTVESTIAATVLGARTPNLGWLIAAAAHRDHPYNLARRVASVDHLSEGRSGLLLGLADRYAPRDRAGHEVWGGAGLTEGVPLGVETTSDAATVIQELWQSWPRDSIVADRASGVYARAEQIVQVDHRGVFDVEGPLTVPTTPQGAPVLGWRADTSDEARAAGRGAELLVWPADGAATLDEVAGAQDAAALFVELPVAGNVEARVAGLTADPRVAGLVLRPGPAVEALATLIADVVPRLLAAGSIERAGPGTLRERLRLGPPAARLRGARPAFSAAAPS